VGELHVRTIVLRDCNIGVRRLRKRADNGGTELKGDWDPIIKPDKHRKVWRCSRSLNADRTAAHGRARKHLLTTHRQVREVRRNPARHPPTGSGF